MPRGHCKFATLHIFAYSVHIYAYFNLHTMTHLPLCIFKHILHIWAYKIINICTYFENAYICIFGLHICAYFCAYLLHASHLHICAYSCIFCTAYCCIFHTFSAYFNLHIRAYLPLYIFKHITHMCAYKYIYKHILALLCTYIAYFSLAYLCKFLAYLVLHILHIVLNNSTMAYLPLCIFQLISAHLHLLCLPANQFNKY